MGGPDVSQGLPFQQLQWMVVLKEPEGCIKNFQGPGLTLLFNCPK